MDARKIAKAREGAKAARQKFAPVVGENKANRPLEVVQIDHTPADIILVDSFERQPIGRPWVTLAIDVATRMVTGYYASLEAPSRLSVALCLTQAVAPKAELLAELVCNVPWPAQGKPRSIHVDNGHDLPVVEPSVGMCGMGDRSGLSAAGQSSFRRAHRTIDRHDDGGRTSIAGNNAVLGRGQGRL